MRVTAATSPTLSLTMSVRKILTQSYHDLLAALKITDDEWPRCRNGHKKPDNGLLPILYAIAVFWLTKATVLEDTHVFCSPKQTNRKKMDAAAQRWMRRE
jgi:hypothetical protein